MATHSRILARRIPRTEEPGGLQSWGISRVRHELATKPPPRNRPSLSVRRQENRNKGATKVSGLIYLTKTYEAAKQLIFLSAKVCSHRLFSNLVRIITKPFSLCRDIWTGQYSRHLLYIYIYIYIYIRIIVQIIRCFRVASFHTQFFFKLILPIS